MPRYQLFISFPLIHLFFQCLNMDQTSALREQCHVGGRVWFCPEGKRCGDTTEYCRDDLGTLNIAGIIVLTIFSVLMICLSAVSIYCFCNHRKRRAPGAFARGRQTTTEGCTQQQVSIHINSNTQTNTELPIVETHPPV